MQRGPEDGGRIIDWSDSVLYLALVMSVLNEPRRLLSLCLSLVALHSFFVGLALIAVPSGLMETFGYERVTEVFFKVQGGVFHLVMCVAYVMAAADPDRNSSLVVFSLVAKFVATAFLLLYYASVAQIPVVLLSGFGDFIMGLVILLLFNRYRRMKTSGS